MAADDIARIDTPEPMIHRRSRCQRRCSRSRSLKAVKSKAAPPGWRRFKVITAEPHSLRVPEAVRRIVFGICRGEDAIDQRRLDDPAIESGVTRFDVQRLQLFSAREREMRQRAL